MDTIGKQTTEQTEISSEKLVEELQVLESFLEGGVITHEDFFFGLLSLADDYRALNDLSGVADLIYCIDTRFFTSDVFVHKISTDEAYYNSIKDIVDLLMDNGMANIEAEYFTQKEAQA